MEEKENATQNECASNQNPANDHQAAVIRELSVCHKEYVQ